MRKSVMSHVAVAGASLALGTVLGVSWERARDVPKEHRASPRAIESADADADKDAASDKRRGVAHTCNVCGTTGKFGRFAGRTDSVCPKCKSKERHRLLIHYLEHGTDLFDQKLDVLHFSPEQAEEDVLRAVKNWNYVTADYLHEEDLRLDLTDLDQPDASWDVLIVYHILEHIVEDEKAMSEMFRILRPGGQAILQVPIDHGRKENFEDDTITSDRGRAKAFGQKDHVRRYGFDGFKQRLEAAGFEVEPVDYLAQLDPDVVKKHAMAARFKKKQAEHIWIARKPKTAAADAQPSEAAKPENAAERGPTRTPAKADAAAKPEAAAKPGAAAKPKAPAKPKPAAKPSDAD